MEARFENQCRAQQPIEFCSTFKRLVLKNAGRFGAANTASALTKTTLSEAEMAHSRICTIPGCGKREMARGWCNNHYYRWKRNGDPLGGGTAMRAAVGYFRETVLTYEGNDCLTWPYARDQNGYGRLRINGRLGRVGRLVCEAVYGPPPPGKYAAAHSCGKGHEGCANPNHLSWKTYAENEADKMAHGTYYRGGRR